MQIRGLLLIIASVGLVGGCTRKMSKEDTLLIGAECSIMDAHVWETKGHVPKSALRKYQADFHRMIAPGYDFKITDDPDLEARLLAGALRRSDRIPETKMLFLHWARDERDRVRRAAMSQLYALVLDGHAQVFSDMKIYLAENLPAEHLAEMLSICVGFFPDKAIGEKALDNLEAKSSTGTPAAKYLKKAARLIRKNNGKIHDDIGHYPEGGLVGVEERIVWPQK